MKHSTRGRPPEGNGLPHGRNPTTSPTLEYSDEEVEFLKAIDRYKREHRRPCPTWIEVLDVLRGLGWRKVEPAGPLPKFSPPPTELQESPHGPDRQADPRRPAVEGGQAQ